MAQIKGSIIDILPSGVGPGVEGVPGLATFEAVEGLLLQVGGEAAAGARRGAVQGAWAALLGTLAAAGPEAEEAVSWPASRRGWALVEQGHYPT